MTLAGSVSSIGGVLREAGYLDPAQTVVSIHARFPPPFPTNHLPVRTRKSAPFQGSHPRVLTRTPSRPLFRCLSHCPAASAAASAAYAAHSVRRVIPDRLCMGRHDGSLASPPLHVALVSFMRRKYEHARQSVHGTLLQLLYRYRCTRLRLLRL